MPCATLLAAPEQHVVGVVECNGAVCSWIHAFVLTLLEADPSVEIGGLVIGADWRGQGLGAMLLDAGEHWARRRGIASVSLRRAAPSTATTRTASTCARVTNTSRTR